MSIKSAYLHIPFCQKRCFYCDFPITVMGNKDGDDYPDKQKQYVDFICREIKITAQQESHSLDTVFFGGGTPSLLAIEGLSQILETLSQYLGINESAEISLEIDPATFDLNKLRSYQKLGVTRVSLGVQSFQDHLLEKCGRIHRQQDIYDSVKWIEEAGFDNWSLDLISGLPFQTLEDCIESLEKAIALQPKHLSCYDLVIEPTTLFGKKYEAGRQPLPSDDKAAQMYRLSSEYLRNAGYIHYEISNYAQPNYQCRHNQVYWQNKSYYGFGLGAASYCQNQRFTRPPTRTKYYEWVEKLEQQNGKLDVPFLSDNERLLETLMLGLRLKKGVNLDYVSDRFGSEISKRVLDCIFQFEKQSLIKYDRNSKQLSLSDPEGFLYSNTVLTELFSELEE